jgi:hypothetical protein
VLTTAGSSRRRRGAIAGAFAALAACLIAIGAFTSAASGRADGVKKLGKTAHTPQPSCPTPSGSPPPKKQCQAFGEVTGFQKKADGKKNLFQVPAQGKIVGWAVDLAKPDKKERNFFAKVLGDQAADGAPTARIALLSKADGKKYRLRAQSPRMSLNSLLGEQQVFTLNNPIPVQKKWIVALTTPTWIPNFAHDFGGSDRWVASRTRKRCTGEKNLTQRSSPHTGVGSTRVYACTYNDARLLYWAYFVPD